MRNDDDIRAVQHTTDYEAFEERLVLSAQSWGDFALEPLAADATQAQVDSATPAADYARELTEDLAYIKQRYGLHGDGQTVAIIDSGIAYDHLALGAGLGPDYRVVGGWDFTDENDADPYDDGPAGFHGTHIAGIIGSDDAEHPGVADAVDLVALRVFSDQGSGRFDWLEDALGWVHENRNSFENPITTVNLSLGTNLRADDTEPWEMLEDDFAQLKADGIFVAVAAGNAFEDTGVGTLTYPASSQYVVPVGSLTEDGRLSDFSQRDFRILAAPGERVTSTVPSHVFGGGVPNDFAYAHGTSMATPYVAGGSVLVREAMDQAGYEGITQDTIENHLRATADSVYDADTQQTYLSMNLRRAIDSLQSDLSGSSEDANDSVSQTDATVHARGTDGDDSFEFHAGVTHRIVVNGVEYQFDSTQVDVVEFSGLGGNDEIIVVGDSGDETVHVHPGLVELAGGDLEIRAEQVQFIVVQSNGGFDQAHLYDSPGDDTLEARRDYAELTGSDFQLRVEGFARVQAHSESGGNDLAYLYDSPGNDRFYGRPSYASLSGLGFNNRADGFDRVYATAEAGGRDVANFYDSSGNDRFYARPEHSTMSGMNYQNRATGFDRVYAYATVGGNDQAHLYDTPADDRFHGRATYASMSGPNLDTQVHGFDRVSAYSVAGGEDRAYFHDTAGDDRFHGRPTHSSMSGVGFYNYARGFDYVHAYATGGQDTAYLYGSFRDEVLSSTTDTSVLSRTGFSTTVERFESVAVQGGGGVDEAVFREVGEDDSFYGRGPSGSIENADSVRSFDDFDEVTLEGHDVEADIAALEYVFRQAGQ